MPDVTRRTSPGLRWNPAWVLALLAFAACGNTTADITADESAGDEGVSGSAQELESTAPYYHWSARTDPKAPQWEQCSPNLLKIEAYLLGQWGGQDLGCHYNRFVRGQGNSTVWSTHAWGAAVDYTSGDWATNFGPIASFLIAHSEELGINAIHDYRRVSHPDGTVRGRIWKPGIGWKPSNIGAPGTWMHIEVRLAAYSDGRSVEERVGGGGQPVGDGCNPTERNNAQAYGCACVDGAPNGGWCPGSGCSASQTQACSQFAAGCVDGACSGIFSPGYNCTRLEFKNCGTYNSGCTNHQCLAGAVGGDDGRSCSQQALHDCGQFGCGCKNDQCSDGSCPILP
jgi:hypothetical protein